eukprot:Rhum_TRINITY_DN14596_c7_g3::Rhum_TRINITY_DN14596_c7_g3_i1::g.101005::m.101005
MFDQHSRHAYGPASPFASFGFSAWCERGSCHVTTLASPYARSPELLTARLRGPADSVGTRHSARPVLKHHFVSCLPMDVLTTAGVGPFMNDTVNTDRLFPCKTCGAGGCPGGGTERWCHRSMESASDHLSTTGDELAVVYSTSSCPMNGHHATQFHTRFCPLCAAPRPLSTPFGTASVTVWYAHSPSSPRHSFQTTSRRSIPPEAKNNPFRSLARHDSDCTVFVWGPRQVKTTVAPSSNTIDPSSNPAASNDAPPGHSQYARHETPCARRVANTSPRGAAPRTVSEPFWSPTAWRAPPSETARARTGPDAFSLDTRVGPPLPPLPTDASTLHFFTNPSLPPVITTALFWALSCSTKRTHVTPGRPSCAFTLPTYEPVCMSRTVRRPFVPPYAKSPAHVSVIAAWNQLGLPGTTLFSMRCCCCCCCSDDIPPTRRGRRDGASVTAPMKYR